MGSGRESGSSLAQRVDKIDQEVFCPDTKRPHGMVRQIRRGDEMLLADAKDNAVSVFDDAGSVWYHRKLGANFEPVQQGGRRTVYKINHRIRLVGYVKHHHVIGNIIKVLSLNPDILLQEMQEEALKVMQDEGIKTEPDMAKYLFSITYTLTTYSDTCVC